MMRSLYSGVAGLKTHQTKMDVIGNNIANVNTVAFKSSSVTFSELMYQTTQAASGANADTGRAGINAKQIGLGVKNGAISTNISTSGASQSTGNPFDIQLNGDSFFIVNNGSGQNLFTRAGTFTIDGNGTLCMTTNGYAVMGWQADEEGNIIKNTVSQLRPMSAEYMVSNPEATSEGYMSGILDSYDKQVNSNEGQVSTLQFYDSKGYSYTMKFSITKIVDGDFEMVASDLLDSTGKSLLTNKVCGVTFTPSAGMTAEEQAAAQKAFEEKEADSADKKAFLEALDLFGDQMTGKAGDGSASSFEIKYSTVNGSYIYDEADDATKGFTLDLSKFVGSALDLDGFSGCAMKVDLSASKNIDNNGTSTISGKTGRLSNTAVGAGRAAGDMDTLSVDISGKIIATYTNGVTRILGQIAVASFANAAGLQKEGDNLYSATQNSGAFDGVGQDVSADGGSMSSGVLEMSNVDLSSEFTEMITTQRGFQANSRIITVSDTLIEELVNLKR